LAKLEQEDRAKPKGFEDLPLFAKPYVPPQKLQDGAYELMITAVAALNPDDMSPREAIEALYLLKAKLAATGKQ
jgi:DNA mismatch repair protein MutS